MACPYCAGVKHANYDGHYRMRAFFWSSRCDVALQRRLDGDRSAPGPAAGAHLTDIAGLTKRSGPAVWAAASWLLRTRAHAQRSLSWASPGVIAGISSQMRATQKVVDVQLFCSCPPPPVVQVLMCSPRLQPCANFAQPWFSKRGLCRSSCVSALYQSVASYPGPLSTVHLAGQEVGDSEPQEVVGQEAAQPERGPEGGART